MGIAFVPIYIKYLGIESYGLIGLFTMLQTWLIMLDMGMTPALSREMARFTGGAHSAQTIRDLLRSVEILASIIACLIAAGVWLTSGWLANDWLKVDKLPPQAVAQALAIMGIVISLRFVEGIYRSAIIGLQRQVLFNIVTVIIATLRFPGAIGILAFVSPTIGAFFFWQGFVSVIAICALAFSTYHFLPKAERSGRFSFSALHGIWYYAGGMMGIIFLSLLLTQVDKILLSKLLTLKEYGYYTLATVIAGGLSLLLAPIGQAWHPRLCELYARNDQPALAAMYHKGAQLVSVIAGSTAVVIILFAETIIQLWTQDNELAIQTKNLVQLLTLGNLLNGLMWIPYQTQLAYGWTGLTLRINTISVLLIIPAILWVTPKYGPEGAALIWVILNAGYVFIGINFMYRRILSLERWRWYLQDILIPIASAFAIAVSLKLFLPASINTFKQIISLCLVFLLTFFAAVVTGSHTRSYLFNFVSSFFRLQPRTV